MIYHPFQIDNENVFWVVIHHLYHITLVEFIKEDLQVLGFTHRAITKCLQYNIQFHLIISAIGLPIQTETQVYATLHQLTFPNHSLFCFKYKWTLLRPQIAAIFSLNTSTPLNNKPSFMKGPSFWNKFKFSLNNKPTLN